jgi:hypothetical protein
MTNYVTAATRIGQEKRGELLRDRPIRFVLSGTDKANDTRLAVEKKAHERQVTNVRLGFVFQTVAWKTEGNLSIVQLTFHFFNEQSPTIKSYSRAASRLVDLKRNWLRRLE